MKTNHNNSKKNTDKTSKNIRNNALFTDITAQEEVFVQGGRFRAPELLFKPTFIN
ncbi:hypothetical protein PCC9214_02905 [Planktothrix tepida]|uniref:Uncharacterized protein n=1 Tax=Planktothrix tepida PCC 9214 TaxID=671072 RepID=A0A1J1LPC5_9CYAN|nr:hypothetical protein [Planktothrix tepida]CAD5956598.1 hypothetical protein PCC9214_02905 [Planktothrix tepida]CUR34094.1 hypothetical protein PL9214640101 [Planktothrix tepida PCC 9214]